jgi:hypothetical protein
VNACGFQNVGLTQLHTAASMQDTLRSPLCSLVLLCWHLIGGYLVGADANIPLCERLLVPLLRDYPQVCPFLTYAAHFPGPQPPRLPHLLKAVSRVVN